MFDDTSQKLDYHRLLLFKEQIRELTGLINAEINFLPYLDDILSNAATYLNAESALIAITGVEDVRMASFGLSEKLKQQLKAELQKEENYIDFEEIKKWFDHIQDVVTKTLKDGDVTVGQCIFINRETRNGVEEFNQFDYSLIEILNQQLELATQKLRKHNQQQSLLSLNQSVLNATSGAVLAIEEDGSILTFNQKAIDFFQLDEMKDYNTVFDLVPKGSPIKRFITQSMKDYSVKMADGLPLSASMGKVFRVYVAPFDDPNRNGIPWVISLEDKTELNKIKDTFTKYVSEDVLNHALSSDHNVRLGGERRECAILFNDIRGYTKFSESKDPEEVVETLNQYFNAMIEPIHENQGSIDKIVGDEIMAVFHHKEEATHPIYRTIDAALKMRESLALFNSLRDEQDLEQLNFGIGIHFGEVICGNIGSLDRMDYTIIGDNVNTAARFCGMAKSDEIIISESVYRQINGAYECEKLEPIEIKGKSGTFNVYKVTGKR